PSRNLASLASPRAPEPVLPAGGRHAFAPCRVACHAGPAGGRDSRFPPHVVLRGRAPRADRRRQTLARRNGGPRAIRSCIGCPIVGGPPGPHEPGRFAVRRSPTVNGLGTVRWSSVAGAFARQYRFREPATGG